MDKIMIECIKTEEKTLNITPDWCHCAEPCGIFPGVCVKPDGTLALLMVSGSAFESADQRLAAWTGEPDGLHWQLEGVLPEILSGGVLFSAAAKPAALPDGTLVALGYGFERADAAETLSGHAEKYGVFPPVRNAVWFSHDGGRSYSAPQWLNHRHGGIEFSGPALVLRDGRLLGFGAPFHLAAADQCGLCFESCDSGLSWREKSTFFTGGAVAPWECRGLELSDGRIVVVFWAFDLAAQKHLTNRIAVSADGGAAWQVLDTGLSGQAANLIDCGWADGTFGLLQARREGDAPGLYLSRIELHAAAVTVHETVKLYDAANGANVTGDIARQFYHLKFGQPALHRLRDGGFLLVFWRCNTAGGYEIVLQKFHIAC